MLATIYQLEAYRREPPPPPAPPTMRSIALEVCARYRVGLADLRSPCRKRYIVRPRDEFFALAYATGRFSYPQMARWCGGRDHTTALAARRRHLKRLALTGEHSGIGSNGGPPLEAWA